ncbi:hypothetical protein Rhopal_004606-T1 [Rhodotorula paludigena]|uniref:Type 2A phosphatase activator TIP41 n=1 Tax=Rhodotorula paludigena TaxID=86838 RepID=A0AAV5GSE1_9BASI|nr:hypothetical protein Rhopal_004606-T1 [Rhodotorula paludigena]
MATTRRHRLVSDSAHGQRAIEIAGWTVHASADLELALPEICFGNNALTIRHAQTGFQLEWNTLDMLRAVKKGDGWDAQPGAGAVRVAYADEWSRAQAASGSSSNITVQKPFDWTYTTLHRGTTTASPSAPTPTDWQPAPPTHPGIPLAELARTDIPILFFDEVPLFEDELGDNGIADVTVRVRVNHTSFFVLARFALRIDGVLFRQFDTRLFHRFGTRELVRESKGREAPYHVVRDRLRPHSSTTGAYSPGAGAGALRARASPAAANGVAIPSRTGYASPLAPAARSPALAGTSAPVPALGAGEPAADLTPLTDINWVAGVLEELALAEGFENGLRVGGQRGEGRAADRWEGLGRRLEILQVPWAATPPDVGDGQ